MVFHGDFNGKLHINGDKWRGYSWDFRVILLGFLWTLWTLVNFDGYSCGIIEI